VLSASGTNNGGDTLVLGGDTIAGGTIPTFNASSIVATGTGTQFVGFSNFVKTGAASWMLTGNGTGQNWTIANGTLIGDTNSFTGDLLFAAVPGDSAQVKFQQDSSGTYAGRIDGVGTLLKAGTGTLTFTTAHTYTGQTAVGQGTLALSGAGGIAGSTLVVGPAGTFDISATNGSSVQGLVGDGTVELGAQTLTLSNAAVNKFYGSIAGSGGLTVAGGSEWLGGADNSYTGTTTINSGATLALVDAGSIASSSGLVNNGTFSIASTTNGATITDLAGSGSISLGSQTLTLSNAHGAFSGVIGGTGGATLAGGTETLGGANTYTGTTTVNSGATLALSGLGRLSSSSAVIADGDVDIGGTSGSRFKRLEGSGQLHLGSQTLTLAASASAGNFSGVIADGGLVAGTGGSLVIASGSQTLSGANTYTGSTTVDAGATLALGGTGSIADSSGVTSNGAFDISGTTNGATIKSLAGSGTVNLGSRTLTLSNANETLSGAISGTGGVTLASGTETLSGANTYTGGTAVDAGARLALIGTGSIANSSLANNGTFDISGTTSGAAITALAGNGRVWLGGQTLTLSNANGTLDGSIDNGPFGSGGSLAITGGTQTLSGLNTYNGTTTIANGATLALSGMGGAIGPGSIADSSGVINDGTFDISRTVPPTTIQNLTGSGTVNLGSKTLTLANGGSAYGFAGVIADGGLGGGAGGSLVVTSGTQTLSGANSYSGSTTVNGGAALALSGAGSIASSSGLTNDGTFDIGATANGATIKSLAGSGTVALGTRTLTLSNASGTFDGVIGGNGGLAIAGGREVLTGQNNYGGGTTIHQGTLQIGNGGTSGSIQGNFANNGTLAFNRSDAVSFGGAISGSGAVQQLGTGTLTLTGANNYTGGTTISQGTLQIGNGGTSGSIQGDVVNDGTLAFNRSDAVSFSGTISGTGAVQHVGTGTAALTGQNSYSGGTTISQGTLQIGNGGTTGSIQGNVTNNGMLAFNRSDAVAFGGTISGSGVVQQLGSGTLTLTGTHSYSGDTLVNAGTLLVNGTLALAVSVNAGATLGGNGAVGSLTLNAGATLMPGNGSAADEAKTAHIAQRRAGIADGSAGALTVNGSLVLGAGSVYTVHADAAGHSSQTVVNGSATLQGGTVQVLADNSGTYSTRTRYTILSASALDGSFSGASSNLAFLDPTLSYDASHVFLTLARNDVDFAAVAASGNQRAVGSALQQASQGTLSDAGSQLIGAVQSLSAEQARGAFDAMSGSALAGAQNLALLSSQTFVASLQQPLQAAREPMRGDASETAPHWWAALLESGARLPGHDDIGSAPERDRLWGVALGVDQSVNARLRVGAALGFSQGAFSVSPQQTNGTVRGWHAGVYGQWQFEPWYMNAQLAYGGFDNHVSRSIDAFGGLPQQLPMQADYGSQAWRARLELGRPMAWRNEGHFTPYAALELAEVRSRGYSESGSPLLGLNVAGQTTRSTPSYLGLRLDDRHTLAGGTVLTPSVDVAWVHEFSRRRSVTAAFSALPDASFTTEGARPARDALALKLGAQLALSRNATLYARVGGELADRASSYSAQAGVQVRW